MFRTLKAVICVAVLCGGVGVLADEGLAARPLVVVSVFNDARVNEAVLSSAQERAAKILREAGVNLVWLDCGHGERDVPDGCLRASDQRHFALRIIPRSLTLKSDVFGVAFLGEDGVGSQADVFFDEVEKLDIDRRIGVSGLLGHVIAHELGHLMLGNNSHAASGIMRPRWQAEELQRILRGALLFDPQQADHMRTRLRLHESIEARLVR
jgi:hypothetical protein